MTENLIDLLFFGTGHDGAPLKCREHVSWFAEAAGASLADLIRKGQRHLWDEHRTHVDRHACRDRVTDTRCLPNAGVILL